MNIDARIAVAEQKFETKSQEREQLIKQAEEALLEMNKLQGEYRLLQELKAEQNEQAPTVEVVDEGKPKKEGK